MRITYLKLRVIFLFAHPIKSLKKILNPSLNLSNIDKSIFLKYVEQIKTIVEAGAADGVDTLEFTELFPNANIFAIEPVMDQFNFLKKKFKNFKKVQIFNMALDSKIGTTEIFIGSNKGFLQGNGSSSLLMPTQHKLIFPEISFKLKQQVDTETLTNFCYANGITYIDLLWLDLQGKEFDVIKASEEYMISHVKLIHTELSRIQLYDSMKTEEELNHYLRLIGFESVVDAVGAISGNRLYANSRFQFKS
jgi:FkbM family methyltransferase